MAVEVDRVIVALEARLDNYDRKLNDAERHFDRTMRNIDTSAGRTESRITAAFRGIGTAAALAGISVAALTTAMAAGAVAAVNYAAGLAETARQTGLTVEELQVLERAGIRSGFSLDQASSALETLNRNLGEARSGKDSTVRAFESIGIPEEQLRNIRSVSELLPIVMDRISELRTETEQAAAAERVFGEAGRELLPLLRQGSAAYEQLARETQESGVLTGEQAEQAREASVRMRELAQSIKTDLTIALLGVLPLFEQGIRILGEWGSTAVWAAGQVGRLFDRMNDVVPLAVAMRDPNFRRAAEERVGNTWRGAGTGATRDPAANDAGLLAAWRFQNGRRLGEIDAPRAPRRGGGGRGRSGPDPAEIARREAEAERRFQFELSQIEEDILLARSIWATSAQQVADFEVRQIEAARDRENENYLAEAENARTNQAAARARAAQLVEANNRLAAEKVNNARLQQREREQQEAAEIAQADLQNQADLERATGQLADTRQAQRDSALALLDLSLEQERLELEAVIASREATDAQRQIAEARLRTLGTIRDAAQRGILRDTESPRERYLRGLNRTAEQMGDDLDEVAIGGFERLNDELTEAITGFVRLGGVAGRVLDSILSDLLRIGIQQQIIRPLANALFGGGSIGSIFGGGKADGGPVSPSKAYLVGERGPELFVPSSAGNIVPQGRSFGAMPGMAGAGAGGGLVKVQLALSGDIDARIVRVSGPVAVEVVQQAAPQIVRAAGAETMRTAMRPRLNR